MDDPNVWMTTAAAASKILQSLGIKLPDLFAGFAGGIVNASALRRLDPRSALSSMVVGGLMANYMSETFTEFIGHKPGFAAFLIGAAGTPLVQRIIEASRSWGPFGSTKGKDSDDRPSS